MIKYIIAMENCGTCTYFDLLSLCLVSASSNNRLASSSCVVGLGGLSSGMDESCMMGLERLDHAVMHQARVLPTRVVQVEVSTAIHRSRSAADIACQLPAVE